MRTFHFYDASTGLFTGGSLSLSGNRLDVLAENTPGGCGAYEGIVDYLSQRVDVETGELADYQPPRPDSNHEWDLQAKRWLKRADVINREVRRATAQARVAELELKALRPLRELRKNPNDAAAAARLKEIEDEVDALTPTLRG